MSSMIIFNFKKVNIALVTIWTLYLLEQKGMPGFSFYLSITLEIFWTVNAYDAGCCVNVFLVRPLLLFMDTLACDLQSLKNWLQDILILFIYFLIIYCRANPDNTIQNEADRVDHIAAVYVQRKDDRRERIR